VRYRDTLYLFCLASSVFSQHKLSGGRSRPPLSRKRVLIYPQQLWSLGLSSRAELSSNGGTTVRPTKLEPYAICSQIEGKEEEMRYWRARGCEAWLEYTGEEYPDRLSYRIVMQGDNIRRRRIREHRLSQKQTDFERLQDLTRQLKSRLKIFKRGDNLAAAFKKKDEE
jgi:hypothetical protein